ncbi:MAG: hypothetical protein LRY55_10355 [Leadbetterella sp.]|nr:hypothetical protein [Leadbetterella sp.]
MKRLFFSLALLLVTTFAFANSQPVTRPAEKTGTGLSPGQKTGEYTHGDRSYAHPPGILAADCTIKGTITIIFNDGTQMTLKDAYITFKGVSCGQLLKEIMS